MNNTLNKVLWFTAGAAVGVAVTYNFFKTKYERIAQEEIDSVKRAFSTPQQSEPVADDTENAGTDEPTVEDMTAYNSIISTQGYSVPDGPVEPIRKEVNGVSEPRVISPADFDTEDDYETISLNYFEDGVLADDMGNVVENIDATVGRDSLTRFGEYEDDSVHVRNDAMRCDFEILRDLRKYSDVYYSGPRPDDD